MNYDEILKEIKEGTIQIFYSFYKDREGNINFVSEEIPFQKYENAIKLLYSDRLKLTLGPLVKSHQNKSFSIKKRFKNDSKCIDIRRNLFRYILKPGESITVLTNERIILDGNHSAIIIPKVSLSEVGISLTPAYIDPYYDGLLRLLVTNTTENSFELKLLDVIAQCYFFKLGSEISQEFKEQFPRKSVFFGHNWERIMNEDVNPFPSRKVPVLNFRIGEVIRTKLENFWRFLQQNSLIASVVTFIIISLVSYGKIKNDYLDFSTKSKIVDSNRRTIDSLSVIFGTLHKNIDGLVSDLKLKQSEIIIPIGKNYGVKKIKLPYPKEDIIAILTPNAEIHYILTSGDSANECFVEFRYDIHESTKEIKNITFEYVVLKEIN